MQVEVQGPLALSRLTEAEGKVLLTGTHRTPLAELDFPPSVDVFSDWGTAFFDASDLDTEAHGFANAEAVFDNLGQDLHIRCRCSDDPQKPRKELSRRELVSPVLFTACFITGDFSCTILRRALHPCFQMQMSLP